MKLLNVILLFLLVSCGLPKQDLQDPRESTASSSELSNYVHDFEDSYFTYTNRNLIVQTPIHFSNRIYNYKDSNGNAPAGICLKWIKGNEYITEILIRESLWNVLSENSKTVLIFHELGHCELNKKHNSSKIKGIPLSIMNPYIIGSYYFSKYREEYLREFFLGESWTP